MDQQNICQASLMAKSTEKDTHYLYYNNLAIFISTVSLFYNLIEGGVSVYFGEVSDSISLFFFGVQSFVELMSSIIVLWKVMTSYANDSSQIQKERRATIIIGVLFIFLCIGTLVNGSLSLKNHSSPSTTVPGVIVSCIATVIMFFLWITKKKLAAELNSSTIQSDAQCSLACIRITTLLLLGSLVFHFWNEAWWIDAAVAIVLCLLFGKEGVQMLRWAASKDFNGGCCGGCTKMPEKSKCGKEFNSWESKPCKSACGGNSDAEGLKLEYCLKQESCCGEAKKGCCTKPENTNLDLE